MAVQPSSTSPLHREQIARIEVGRTTISPVLARTLVAACLLMLAALPAIDAMGGRPSTDVQPARVWSPVVGLPRAVADRWTADARADGSAWSRLVGANGVALQRLATFETALEDETPVGRLLRPHTQQILSGWLGVGNERVYAGQDGWLFYRLDVDYVTGRGFLSLRQLARRATEGGELAARPQPDPRLAIRRFHADLDARGIALVVMPTPVKPTVHPERLARAGNRSRLSASSAPGSAPMVQSSSYEAFVDGLRSDGVLVFDAATAIARVRGESDAPAYLAGDTHWRPETMQRAAEALVAFLDAHVPLPPVPSQDYRTEPREARHAGDTVAMLDLPAGQTLYPPERVPLRFVVRPDGEPWRPSRDADVLVLGDSFSNMYSLAAMGWGEASGFVEQISYLLQRPVDRIVQNDQGAHATRALLARDADGPDGRLAGKRVVVWQFAARELAFGDWRLVPLPRAHRENGHQSSISK